MIKIFNRLKSEIGELLDVINMSYKKPFNSLMTAELTIKADNPAIIHLKPFNFIEVTDDYSEYIGVFRIMSSSPTKEGDSATIKYSLYQAGHTLIDSAIRKSKIYTNVSAYDIVSELLTLQSHKYWVVDGSLRNIQIPLYKLEVQNGLLSTIFDVVNSYSEKMVVFDTSNIWTIKVKDIPTINCRIKEGYNLTSFDIEENYLSIINRVYTYAEWSEYDNDVEVSKRVTMASVNNNKEYVENTDLVNKYGVIEKVELFSEETTPRELLDVANKILRQHTQRVKSIRVSAVDMVKASTNDLSIDLLRVGNRVFFDSDDFGTSELVIMSESKSDIFGKPEAIDLEISMDKDSTSITSTIRDIKANIKGVTTIAERAIMSANGKNKVYYTPENQPPLQPQNGDIWFRDNVDGTTSYLVRIADSWVDKSPSINTDALEASIDNNRKIIEAAQAAANAAVKPGEIFDQINRQSGNVLIRAEEGGAKLNITKDNVFMDSAVIKQSNIDVATINDAFLKNVTFDWARGKTIDANDINVVNLTGRNLTFDSIFVNRFNASGIGADIDMSSNQSINRTVSNQVIGKLSEPSIREQFKGEKGEDGSNFNWNLLVDSNKVFHKNDYTLARYNLSVNALDLKIGDEVTLVVKGHFNDSGRTHFSLFNSSGYGGMANTYARDFENGIRVITFDWKIPEQATTPNTFINIYQYPDNNTTGATIEWITLVKGKSTSTTEWFPSIEDIQGKDASIYSDTPPEDTTRLWIDSRNNTPKYFNRGKDDWVEVTDEVYEEIKDVQVNLEAKITELPGEIISTASKQFVSIETGENILEKISSVDQTADGIIRRFDTYMTNNDEKVDNIDTTINKFSTIISEGTNGINISKSNSDFNINIDNDSLDIRNGENVVAYASKDKFYGKTMEVLDEFIFDYVRFMKRDSGNISLIKINR